MIAVTVVFGFDRVITSLWRSGRKRQNFAQRHAGGTPPLHGSVAAPCRNLDALVCLGTLDTARMEGPLGRESSVVRNKQDRLIRPDRAVLAFASVFQLSA
jgi:hypothetical protein